MKLKFGRDFVAVVWSRFLPGILICRGFSNKCIEIYEPFKFCTWVLCIVYGWLLDVQRHFSLKYREWSPGLLVNYGPLGGRLVRTVARGRSRSILTDNFHTGLVPSTSPPSDLIARLALIHLYKCTFLVYSWTEICHIWRTGQKIKGTRGYQPIMIVIFVTKKKLRANYATLLLCSAL